MRVSPAITALCLTLAGLGGCSPEAEAPVASQPARKPPLPDPLPPLEPVPTDASAGRSGQDGLTWMFDHSGRDGRARLIYSARASDELAVNFQCDPGSDAVRVLVIRTGPPDRPPGPWRFALTSGGKTTTLEGEVEGSEELYVTGRARLSAPAIAAFRASHKLSVGDPGQPFTEANAVGDAERAAIDQFFQACTNA
jgi:hypothetical protein